MNKPLAVSLLALGLGVAGTASADTTVVDPPTATVTVSAGGGGGHSGGSATNALGIGVEYILGGIPASVGGGGIGGISANYNTDKFHVGGFFGFNDPDGKDNTAFEIGARFYYHLHRTSNADFSIGGAVGILNAEGMGGTSATPIVIEPGFQARWWATPNFALSFSGGISIGVTNDDKDFSIGGPGGSVGFHYYFSK